MRKRRMSAVLAVVLALSMSVSSVAAEVETVSDTAVAAEETVSENEESGSDDTTEPTDTGSTEDTSGSTETGSTEDTSGSTETGDTEDTTDSTDTGDTEDTTDPTDSTDAEDTSDSTDTEGSGDTSDSTDTGDAEDTSNSTDTGDSEDTTDPTNAGSTEGSTESTDGTVSDGTESGENAGSEEDTQAETTDGDETAGEEEGADEVHVHTYEDAWDWDPDSDPVTAEVTLTCTNEECTEDADGHTVTLGADDGVVVNSETTEAVTDEDGEMTEAGYITYTASVTYEDVEYTDELVVELEDEIACPAGSAKATTASGIVVEVSWEEGTFEATPVLTVADVDDAVETVSKYYEDNDDVEVLDAVGVDITFYVYEYDDDDTYTGKHEVEPLDGYTVTVSITLPESRTLSGDDKDDDSDAGTEFVILHEDDSDSLTEIDTENDGDADTGADETGALFKAESFTEYYEAMISTSSEGTEDSDSSETEKEWEVSKTATNLELDEDEDSDYYGTYLSDVTLSVPSTEVELDTDIVFVLDKSTSPDLQSQAVELLKNLQTAVSRSGASVKVAVVVFNKEATTFGWYDLGTQFDEINTAIYYEVSSGTNTHAGLLAAKELLDSDTEVDANRKYMIFVSDGITYLYDADYTITAWGCYVDNSLYIGSSPDYWKLKHESDDYIPSDWYTYLMNVGTQYAEQEAENNGAGYEYTYKGNYTYYTDPNEYKTYVNSVEIALYKTYTTYQEMVSAGYNCYSIVANTGSGSQYTWGPSFMGFLANDEEIDFGDIEEEILYYLSAGSYIEDYMGYVANEYDFDFVNDVSMLSLEVGDTTYEAVAIGSDADGNPQYGFAPYTDEDGNEVYSYVLTYYYEDRKANEHFRLTFNVAVTNFQRVQLHYTVQLDPDSVTAGAHGVYDADGIVSYTDEDGNTVYSSFSDLLTNSSAVLYAVDSEGNSHGPIAFDQPTVSYLAIPVTKVWNDDHDAAGIRPDEIIVYLYAADPVYDSDGNLTYDEDGNVVYENAEKVPVYVYDSNENLVAATDENGDVIYRTLTLSGDNDWTGLFLIHSYNPNVDDNIKYSVKEVVEVLNEDTGEMEEQEIEGYSAEITATTNKSVETSADGGTSVSLTSWCFVLTNTIDSEETSSTALTTGALGVVKVDAETGERLAGATFALYNDTTGSMLGYYTTDSNGYLQTSQLTLNYTYSFVEVTAPDGYILDSTAHSVTLTSSLSSSSSSPYVMTISNTAEASVLDAERDTTSTDDEGVVLGVDRGSGTGDNSNLLLWILLLIAAGAGLGAAVIYFRFIPKSRRRF